MRPNLLTDFLACARPTWRAGLPTLAALLLCACAATQDQPQRQTTPLGNPPAAPLPKPAASEATELPPPLDTHAVVVSPVNVGTAPATDIPQRQTNITLLAYADRLRSLSTPDLMQEIARLGDPADASRPPAADLQLAMALGQTRVPADLARAQTLLQRVLSNPQEEMRQLQPLARLLSARYAEQKRVEDLLEKQNQQLRDSQRRIDQLNDRLEAMRAIERSLTSRTPGAAHNGGGTGGAANGLRVPAP
ncbi:hypothetical protein RD110_22910 [Rhodoferax koreense]|uniref:Permease n=1 Tax=Rhodoferax koreensis TaxID=1842727 RepID=A0A1P8K4G4_9BURK|nr:hypothetical protein RD110_22910 [Rhodoferax koreense]